MPRVLILEDEAMLRSSMARGLAKLPGIDVVEAGSMADAVRVLEDSPPDLVFSDIDLPDRSGIELLGEMGKRAIHAPVVFVSAYLEAYRAQIPRHADVEVLEKPVGLEQLRRLVRERVGGDAPPSAAPFRVPDYVQLAGLGRHSVTLDVDDGAGCKGVIVMKQGELWFAEDRDGTGEEAFCRLAFHPTAKVECRTLTEEPESRNIEGSWEHILLERARLDDETDEDAEGLSESSPAPSKEDGPFTKTWDRGIVLLLAKKYSEALVLLEKAQKLRPDDKRVAANLERLREMGFGETATDD